VAISSRKSVPWSASSKRERRRRVAPVKAPASWPKSSLEQALGERRAVELDEGLVPARREVGEPRRHQLLAGAALAHHEHRPAERRQRRDLRQRRAKGRRLAD